MRQVGQHVFKFSIKAWEEDEVLVGVSREQMGLCGFMGKGVRHSIARLEHENGQFEQGG